MSQQRSAQTRVALAQFRRWSGLAVGLAKRPSEVCLNQRRSWGHGARNDRVGSAFPVTFAFPAAAGGTLR